MQKYIPYGHQLIDNQDIKEVTKVLKSDWLTQGPKIKQFEEKLAEYVETKYAVAVSSGTAALHAACMACDIGPGDEVIVPTLSFVASANCVLYCRAKPILVDVYPDTLTINVEEVEKRITKKTKAIIAVDFAGHPAQWDKLQELANKYKLVLIDDAAHALGSKYHGQMIGSLADLTTFSFHPVKTITTGEGGVITTNNKSFYEKLIMLRHHGIIKNKNLSQKFGQWYYQIKDLGYNYRMTDIQAALGTSQLKKIDKFIEKRRRIWQKYNQAFGKIKGLILPKEKQGSFCAWHLYPIQLVTKKPARKTLYEKLQSFGIETQIHYIPIHHHTLYKKLGYKKKDFPVSNNYYERALSLPLYAGLTNSQQDFIIRKLKELLE